MEEETNLAAVVMFRPKDGHYYTSCSCLARLFHMVHQIHTSHAKEADAVSITSAILYIHSRSKEKVKILQIVKQ